MRSLCTFERLAVLPLLGILVCAPAAWAQTSAIGGVVRDASGGILPGVTVEAESPALIEGARVAFTDGEGRFTITDLRPGTYNVIFTLPGFNVIRREGIELTTGFTANVSPEMQVGGIEETITVTGESPLVDVQNVRRQTALSNEVLELLPTSNKHINTVVTFTPGFTGLADVGGEYSTQLGGERQRVEPGRLPRQSGEQGVLRRHGHGKHEPDRQQQLRAQRGVC